ncbi:MAG: hypothetical protein R3A13_07525 [Bdellovibrionota bacterium]
MNIETVFAELGGETEGETVGWAKYGRQQARVLTDLVVISVYWHAYSGLYICIHKDLQ